MLTLIDKIEYVNKDFKKSNLYALGEVPETEPEVDEWYRKAIPYASEFMARYEEKGKYINQYVHDLVMDYMEMADRTYRAQITPGKGKYE